MDWLCPECHQIWRASVAERTGGRNCPYCEGRKAIPGKTSLKALYPSIADELADERIDADSIVPGMKTPISWLCSNCHQIWKGSVVGRVEGKECCPFCDGRRAIPGKTSLKALYPELMDEWDDLANTLLNDADKLLPTSSELVWWHCPTCKNRYQAQVKNKTRDLKRNRNSCPLCKGYRKTKHYFV